jgi:hypothetical protein
VKEHPELEEEEYVKKVYNIQQVATIASPGLRSTPRGTLVFLALKGPFTHKEANDGGVQTCTQKYERWTDWGETYTGPDQHEGAVFRLQTLLQGNIK